ncbi:MAG TPA: pteridine-dependent deoxygenase [Stenotrophomonas sp.]|jgi:chorismate lyase/3-hydroxybenzoate synthase
MALTAVLAPAPALAVDYLAPSRLHDALGDPQVLAVLAFAGGATNHADGDSRLFRVGLQPVGEDLLEVWRGQAPVRHGRDGDIAWSTDGEVAFGALEVDEAAHGGIEAAGEYAYQRLGEFLVGHAQPHLLRIWNYFDAITAGDGDEERYRRFCVGRARGIGAIDTNILPAATAIGRVDGVRRLQLYWLSARRPGTPLENPRQVSAYHYPRRYGPQPPSFARAMLPPDAQDMPLMLSGTASVVGHETLHVGQPVAQLEETFSNFAALIEAARRRQPSVPSRFDAHSRLKVYVARQEDLAEVQSTLREHLSPAVPLLMLHAAVCRRDLAVEIDGWHGG